MPPKPQTFKTPDGKEFSTRVEWRDYMMLTFYSFKNKVDTTEPFIKPPGSIEGQMFDIADCSNVTLAVLDHSEQVQVDQLKNCRLMIGACASSIFIRNCSNCVFYTCCRQLRLRDVTNCKFYIYSMSEVHIEFSTGLQFAPFNGGYAEQLKHLQAANLDLKHNLWYDVYDHNDPGKTRANWSLLPESEYETPWFPLGACEPAIAKTRPGSVNREDADAGMQSFSVQQMAQDAQKIASSSPTKPPAAAAAPPAPSPAKAVEATVAAAEVILESVPQSILDDDTVLAKVRAFVGIQAGGSLKDVCAESFTLILPNALVASAADVEISAPSAQREVLVAEPIKYSSSRDFAYLTCVAMDSVDEKGQDLVSHFTFILQRIDNKWLIVHAQKSPAVAA